MFRLLLLTLSLVAMPSIAFGFTARRAVAPSTRRSFQAGPLVMAVGKTTTGKTSKTKTTEISDQLDSLLRGAPSIPQNVRSAVKTQTIPSVTSDGTPVFSSDAAPFKAPSGGRWVFFSAVPLICGSFAWELLSKQPGGFDTRLMMELMVQYVAVFGVFIGVSWVRAEQRGVAFFTKDRGEAQRITDQSEHTATGMAAPLAVIAVSLATIAAIAIIDERFNAFR